jgi:hypothetical protein
LVSLPQTVPRIGASTDTRGLVAGGHSSGVVMETTGMSGVNKRHGAEIVVYFPHVVENYLQVFKHPRFLRPKHRILCYISEFLPMKPEGAYFAVSGFHSRFRQNFLPAFLRLSAVVVNFRPLYYTSSLNQLPDIFRTFYVLQLQLYILV